MNDYSSHCLNDRINRRVQREDDSLTAEVRKGPGTGACGNGILLEKRIQVKHCLGRVHERLPVGRLPEETAPGTTARINLELAAGSN